MFCKQCHKETNNPKFCSLSCSAVFNNKNHSYRQYHLCLKCGKHIRRKDAICRKCTSKLNAKNVLNYTVGQVKELYKDKNLLAIAAKIRGYGKTIYNRSDKPKKCIICGYDKHYEVCHIKPVKSFSDDTTMTEIHSIDNLIALCPNCHWEFDRGLISLW